MADIRVRFAPSPTGYLHVGGARTALYNWLFARRMNGVLILRIEDTDADRSRPELTMAILESLEWLGLNWDEGPFHQSDRLDRYRALAEELERSGHAYPCFCTTEELQAKRSLAAGGRPWKYDGTCRSIPELERQERIADGVPHVVRFRVPLTGETYFDDQVFGRIKVENQELEDFVLLRSDGQPTYHLSVVSDDIDMRVTHVVRGADHLSNTPKQILVYRAAGADLPVFAHLPLILGPDKQRLSKRHGATSVGAYRDQGILPEALVNFLALLGWTPPGGEEILSREVMSQQFDLAAVSKSNAVFDPEKLAWMNSQYLRALTMDRLAPLVEDELKLAGINSTNTASPAKLEQSIALLQPRMRTLKDFSLGGRAFFTDEFEYAPDARKKFWKDPSLPALLNSLAERLARLDSFGPEIAEQTLRALAEESGIKAGLLINATRVALTGQAVAPGLFDVMNVLGRERVVERLRRAVKFLGESGADGD
jgi:glutamyl-tRNA synthetase